MCKSDEEMYEEMYQEMRYLSPDQMRTRLVRTTQDFSFDGRPIRSGWVECWASGKNQLLHGYSTPEQPLKVVLLEADEWQQKAAREAIEAVGHSLLSGVGDVAGFFSFINHHVSCSPASEIDLVLTSLVLPSSPTPEMRTWFANNQGVTPTPSTSLAVILWALQHRVPIGIVCQNDGWRQEEHLYEVLTPYLSSEVSYSHIQLYNHSRHIVFDRQHEGMGQAKTWAMTLLYLERYALIRRQALDNKTRK